MAKKLYYKIGEACRELDIQPYVLRYWETEFPFLRPDKSSSGQRVYTGAELNIIRRIKELLYDEGYTIAGAKKKLEAELQSGGPKTSAASRQASLVDSENGDGGEGAEDDTEEAEGDIEVDAEELETDDADSDEPDIDDSDGTDGSEESDDAGEPGAEEAVDDEPAEIQLSSRAPSGDGAHLDSSARERIQSLARGLRELRAEAKELLELLRND